MLLIKITRRKCKVEYTAALNDWEAARAKNERIKQLVDEITLIEADKSRAEATIVSAKAKISEYSVDAWRNCLQGMLILDWISI